jgi:hypothetical protein
MSKATCPNNTSSSKAVLILYRPPNLPLLSPEMSSAVEGPSTNFAFANLCPITFSMPCLLREMTGSILVANYSIVKLTEKDWEVAKKFPVKCTVLCPVCFPIDKALPSSKLVHLNRAS